MNLTLCRVNVLIAQAASEAEEVVSRISVDEIAAWLVTGLLVGGAVGAIYLRRARGFGLLGNLGLGLLGAFVAGLVTNLLGLEFDWGQIVIGFDELLFALIGAVVVLVGFTWLKSRAGAKTEKPGPTGP